MMRTGCQTYAWQMSLPTYQGRIDHIASVVGRAGFAGLEPEVIMLGDFATAERLRGALEPNHLALAALTLVEDWADEHESPRERAAADAAIALTQSFDGALLALCQMPGPDRHDLRERQQRLLSCVADIAARAEDAGVGTTFHPNSPAGSLFRTSEDYEILLDGLPARVGFTPDLGHVARGGMDALALVGQYRERVNHVHAKDMDTHGQWALIGTGVVPVAEVAELLYRTGYQGWFVLEDESELARRDPDAVAGQLGNYVEQVLGPLHSAPPPPPV
jgi:inosose dehydratase